MTPASSTASTKGVTIERARHLRRWPLLWTASFAVGASVALWAGIFVLVGWVLHLGAPHG